jgi:chromosome partitioning protein
MCRKICKTISVSLSKGGVGKSTGAINLAAALASQGYKTIIIDNDPQGSLSIALGQNPKSLTRTLATKMMNTLDNTEGPHIQDCILRSNTFDLLPSNQKLAVVEKRLTIESKSTLLTDTDELPAELIMRKTLEPLRELYDYAIIDCAPSAGLLTVNALAASDSVLIPMESHYLSFEAVKQTLELIHRIKASLNPGLTIEGILLTKYQDRTTLCRSIREQVVGHYGQICRIFDEPIVYSIKAAEQAVSGTSIFETEPHSKIAAGYMAAAREVILNG